MQTRLQQFLDRKKLTPAHFAEIVGVQRSGISHILSGRNNPSLDFIQKMIDKFPDLNIEWLITGKGDMFKGDIFKEDKEDKILNISPPETVQKRMFEDENVAHEKDTIITSIVKKEIECIVIFHKSGTFKEYFPEKIND